MVDQPVGQAVAQHPEATALVDVVNGGHDGGHGGEEPAGAGHQIGVQHVAMQHAGPPGADQPDQPDQTARVGEAPPHFERLGGESGGSGPLPHLAEGGERHDPHIVSPLPEAERRGQQLLVGASHPHAGGEQQDLH